MIDYFTKEQFEESLPVHKETGKILWKYQGIDKGEHIYTIEITHDILIYVRSSVKADGFSAYTGEDSIRAYLIGFDGKPLGSKTQKWIQRTPGWEKRLTDMLRELWNRAQKTGYCPKCKVPKHIFKIKKDGPNKGKLFCICKKCNEGWKLL